MMKGLKKEALIIITTIIFILLMGDTIISNNSNVLATSLITFFSFIIVFTAYFKPNFLCYLIIFLAPLSVNLDGLINDSGLALSLPAEGLLGVLLVVTAIKAVGGLKFNKSILLHPITLILFTSILWMFISAFTSSIPAISYKRVILKSSFILGFYFVFAHLFITEQNRTKLFTLYGLGIIIPIVNSLITHSQFNFSQEQSFEMTEPFYEDHTLYGACIAFIIPFFILHLIQKIKQGAISIQTLFFIGLLLLLVIAELLSYSRAAWISILGAFAFFALILLKIKPKYFLYTTTIIVVLVTLNFSNIYESIKAGDQKKNNDNIEQHLGTVTDLKSNASNLERINRWVCAYRMFSEKPLLGWGPGTYQFQYSKFQTDEFTTEISSNNGDRGNAHSEYLTYLSEEGIVGLFLFVLLIIYSIGSALNTLYKIEKHKNRIVLYGFLLGLITFYLHGFFNAFSDYEKMSVLVYGALAGIVASDITNNKTNLGNQ